MQVYPLAQSYIHNSDKLEGIWVYDDELVKGMIHIEEKQILELYVDYFFKNQGIGSKLTRNSVYLTKIGYKVYAVDFSIVALKRLKSFARNEGLEIKTKLTDISAIDEISKLELKVDVIVVNHYRVARELYPVLITLINNDGILWVNGFEEVPADNPNIRERDTLQDNDFELLKNCILLDKEKYKVGERKFIRYIWKKKECNQQKAVIG